MPFDGNGNWVSNFSAEADRDAGYKILASRFDNIFIADIAAGFGNCLTRDGQGIIQTNTNANNYRVINVANPANEQDAVNFYTLKSADLTISGERIHTGLLKALTPDVLDDSSNVATTEWMNDFVESATFKANVSGYGIPDYSAGVSLSANTDITMTKAGVVCGTASCANSGECKIKVNGTTIEQVFAENEQRCVSCFFVPVSSGAVVRLETGSGTETSNHRYPLKKFYPLLGA